MIKHRNLFNRQTRKRHNMKTNFLTLILIFLTGVLFAQSYKIDSSFGVNGVKYLSQSRELVSIAVRANNEYVACGYNMVPQSTNYQLALNGLTYSGQIDNSFGNQGLVDTWIDSLTYAYDCAIQPDGKIVVVGTYSSGNTPFAPAMFNAFVMRYHPNGTLDSSFGANGKVLVSLGNECNFAKVKVLPNGKILTAGNVQIGTTMLYLLLQMNANGTYDVNFGNGGVVSTLFPHEAGLWDVDVLHDGSIIASGNEGPYDPSPNPNFDIQMCMIKYTSTGKVDSNFGTNGIVYVDIDPFTDDIIHNLHEQSDGKLIATGVGNNQGVILRFLPNGIMDSTYDGDGIKTVGHVTRISVLQSNDKLITANNYLNAGGQDIKLVRYNTDASLDTTFGVNGNINHAISGTNNYIQYAMIDSLNYILVCGSSDSGSIVARYALVGSTPNAIAPTNSTQLDVKLYPNPTHDNLYLDLESPRDENAVVTIVNAAGQVCKTYNVKLKVGDNSLHLPTHALVNGIYFLSIESNSVQFSTQFIKH